MSVLGAHIDAPGRGRLSSRTFGLGSEPPGDQQPSAASRPLREVIGVACGDQSRCAISSGVSGRKAALRERTVAADPACGPPPGSPPWKFSRIDRVSKIPSPRRSLGTYAIPPRPAPSAGERRVLAWPSVRHTTAPPTGGTSGEDSQEAVPGHVLRARATPTSSPARILRIDGCCLVAQANPGDPYYDIIPAPLADASGACRSSCPPPLRPPSSAPPFAGTSASPRRERPPRPSPRTHDRPPGRRSPSTSSIRCEMNRIAGCRRRAGGG